MRVADVLHTHVGRLVQLYYDLGAKGTAWEEVSADELDSQKQLLAAKPSRLTVPHLRQILLAWDRWTEARPTAADLYHPTAMHLGMFLQQEAKRGPTVAASRMRGFKWLSSHLGLPFPVAAPVVKDFQHAKVGHVPRQAQCLSPGDFLTILCQAQQEGADSIPSQLVILACVACIRCKHFARSQLISHTTTMISAHCSKGKRVKQGSRPPYTWAVPLMPEVGDCVFKTVIRLLEQWQRPLFFVPAFKAGTTRRRFRARQWQQRPMLNHQWVTILKQAAVTAGWDAANLGALSYNSMRRFLPTVANVLRFSEHTAQAIGSWQELPQGEGSSASTSRQLMSIHYSDQRALASAEAKREVLSLFFRLVRHHADTCSASSGSGQPDSFTWEQLANLNHTHQQHTSPATPHVLTQPLVLSPPSPVQPQAIRDVADSGYPSSSLRGAMGSGLAPVPLAHASRPGDAAQKQKKDKKDKKGKKDKKAKNRKEGKHRA